MFKLKSIHQIRPEVHQAKYLFSKLIYITLRGVMTNYIGYCSGRFFLLNIGRKLKESFFVVI